MTQLFSQPKGTVSKPLVVGEAVVVFTVTGDTPAADGDVALVKFAYPYFHQQTIDTETRNTFIKSKMLKDNFNTNFFKIFKTGSQTSSETTTTAAPAAAPAAK